MWKYILKNNFVTLLLIYIIPFLCINIFGERYEGEGNFIHVSFTSFFFYTPGIVLQTLLMIVCAHFYNGEKRYVSLASILILSFDLFFALFLMLIFANMKTPHGINFVVHILFSKTLYWTLTLIVCKIYMLVRLIIMYSRECSK